MGLMLAIFRFACEGGIPCVSWSSALEAQPYLTPKSVLRQLQNGKVQAVDPKPRLGV